MRYLLFLLITAASIYSIVAWGKDPESDKINRIRNKHFIKTETDDDGHAGELQNESTIPPALESNPTKILGKIGGLRYKPTFLLTATPVKNETDSRYANATTLTVDGVVRQFEEVNVPALTNGVIHKVYGQRGDSISEGDLIAQIDDTDSKLNFSVSDAEFKAAKAKADDNSFIKLAEKKIQLATTELLTLQKLKHVTKLEKIRATTEKKSAELELENRVAKQQHSTKISLVANAKRQVQARAIDKCKSVSPITGAIIDFEKQVGEWVNAGDSIATVLRLDRLTVEGFASLSDAAPHQLAGSLAKVEIGVGTQTIHIDGVVKHASPKVELDGKYRIWVEIENSQATDQSGKTRWVIRPGMLGKITLDINST